MECCNISRYLLKFHKVRCLWKFSEKTHNVSFSICESAYLFCNITCPIFKTVKTRFGKYLQRLLTSNYSDEDLSSYTGQEFKSRGKGGEGELLISLKGTSHTGENRKWTCKESSTQTGSFWQTHC